MPEWLVEHGIGEQRALLVEGGEVLAAKVLWPGQLGAGSTTRARLVRKVSGTRRGTAVDDAGREILLASIPREATEGATLEVEITRAAISERGRLKRAQGRVVDDVPPSNRGLEGNSVRRFPPGLWEDVWHNATSGEAGFAGGSLLFSVTPAMTLIDLDGELPPRDLALAAVPQIARALRLFDIGGSIGIDFPTLDIKADRRAIDAALDEALAGWPHERTAMNGFGFVQIVARLEGPSLLHRVACYPAGAAARMALRRAEMVEGPGVTLLTVHPALQPKLRPDWLVELERRTGRPTRIVTEPTLAIAAPHAQLVLR